jgi:hypothetical protein
MKISSDVQLYSDIRPGAISLLVHLANWSPMLMTNVSGM